MATKRQPADSLCATYSALGTAETASRIHSIFFMASLLERRTGVGKRDTHPPRVGAIAMPLGIQIKAIEKEEFIRQLEAPRTARKCPLVGCPVAQPDNGGVREPAFPWRVARVYGEGESRGGRCG